MPEHPHIRNQSIRSTDAERPQRHSFLAPGSPSNPQAASSVSMHSVQCSPHWSPIRPWRSCLSRQISLSPSQPTVSALCIWNTRFAPLRLPRLTLGANTSTTAGLDACHCSSSVVAGTLKRPSGSYVLSRGCSWYPLDETYVGRPPGSTRLST